MNSDILMLFEKMPGTLQLYEALERRILAAYPDVTIMAKATQVSFYNTHAFAWTWPPTHSPPHVLRSFILRNSQSAIDP